MIKFAIVGLLLIFAARVSAQTELENADMLAYVSNENQLVLYDPRDRTETRLLDDVETFLLSRDGRVAFTKLDETDTDLYIFDPAAPHLAPINISQNPTERNYPLAWSLDGRYLAFVSYDRKVQILYVWDGVTATNIMPNDRLNTAERFYADWSHDGRLAFTIQYRWSNIEVYSEVYVWDGSITTNLSQNPDGWDSIGRWSRTGQLMFGSSRAGSSDLYVWDGVSFRDGSPDVDSFIRVAPELKPRLPIWLDDSLIGFTVYPDFSPSGVREIVLWDLEREVIVKQFPISSDKGESWLAEEGQMILSSHLASGTPSYYLDVENTEGEILFSAHVGEIAWSAEGYLAYCRRERDYNDWILSLWDGYESWDIARINYKPVRWQNGQGAFSCNNG